MLADLNNKATANSEIFTRVLEEKQAEITRLTTIIVCYNVLFNDNFRIYEGKTTLNPLYQLFITSQSVPILYHNYYTLQVTAMF